MKLSKPRQCALMVLTDVEKNGAYLNLSLREKLSGFKMDTRDNALATQLVMGVTRYKLYLDEFISSLSSVKLKKMSVWILNILRIGFYSNIFLDKVPVGATVNECVNLARRYGHPSSAAFVNALLRASAGKTFEPKEINVKYSYPLWIVEKWQSENVDDIEALLRSGNETPPVCVRRNTLVDCPVPDCMTHVKDDLYIYTTGGSFEGTPWQKNGAFTVCDGASQEAVKALELKRGENVLDLCAAPGGKSAYAAAIMQNEGAVTACDIYEHKIPIITSTAERLGASIVCARVNDAAVYNREFEGAFDAVMLDAPCSGLGIIRRKPDIKWTKKPEDCFALAKTQLKMLDTAARYVKPHGRLSYTTCTISRTENEENADAFLKEHAEFELMQPYKQLFPHKDNTDGFFIAVFGRKK
ncbi:MAG: 16S rRNA (cytosine(967)-C(5))-methyltransferase RsmB [Clostridia bacterium]|nr:16S rRNA (cytosine(967)-C(5))-methyltransferase RsmB [Clostridia bacterium]